MTNNNTPTVVLVHGGFADASFWTPVVQKLQASGLPVLAPPNPLRGLASDAEYIASFGRDLRRPGAGSGVEDAPVVGRRLHRRQRDPPGRPAAHDRACRCGDDRGRRVALSQPKAVAELIQRAASSVPVGA